MTMTDGSDAERQMAWLDGSQALREGRPAEAVASFRRIVEAGRADAGIWVAIAIAYSAMKDVPGERQALDQALALDPRDLRALMMTADHYAAVGDARAASAYYDTVTRVAASQGAVDPRFEGEIVRAERMRAHYAEVYEQHLRDELGGRALEAPEARRVRRALDLLLGKSDLYLQEPKGFYFPELPNIQYADRGDFPWLDKVEAGTDAIRAELKQVLAEDSAFSPYVEAEPDRPFFDDHGMLGNPDWSAFYLWKGGIPVEANIARCPKTMAALAEAPLCRVPGRTPSVLFSLLRPGAHIRPHHGFTNARFVCHLPLIVPDGCAMRVGSETREWAEGRACVFDDSIEHEAWNRNPQQLRVVMIFDVWRPELGAAERDLISALWQAVDTLKPEGD